MGAREKYCEDRRSFFFALIEREAHNFHLPAFLGLIVKDSYWRWPERDLSGNSIDFFTAILGMSFHTTEAGGRLGGDFAQRKPLHRRGRDERE